MSGVTDGGDLPGFYEDLKQVLKDLGSKHGVNVQPFQALLEDSGLHVALSVTLTDAQHYYAQVWDGYAPMLDLPDYFIPGKTVMNPQTAEQWVLLGLDPLSESYPVRMMDQEGHHIWISASHLKTLQPV